MSKINNLSINDVANLIKAQCELDFFKLVELFQIQRANEIFKVYIAISCNIILLMDYVADEEKQILINFINRDNAKSY
jgi:hypothetical protein